MYATEAQGLRGMRAMKLRDLTTVPAARVIGRWIGVAAINVIVFLVIATGFALVPPASYDLYHLIAGQPSLYAMSCKPVKTCAALPWGKAHFDEIQSLKYTYSDFVSWRLQPVAGKTINVDKDGNRRDMLSGDVTPDRARVWFFGGSTMWGTGARDNETIPAEFKKISHLATFNFGQPGYTSHQELNLLMKTYLAGGHPQSVVFYDGFNNILVGCRQDEGAFGTMQGKQIRDYVDAGTQSHTGSQTLDVFSPSIRAFRAISNRVDRSKLASIDYDCAANSAKARQVAMLMVEDWAVAKSLVEANGGQFIAILQPSAYTGSPNLAYLPDIRSDLSFRKQVDAVYPMVRKILSERHFPYLDLTDIFDGEEHLYIDGCHVIPVGDRKVARAIFSSRAVGSTVDPREASSEKSAKKQQRPRKFSPAGHSKVH